MFALILASNKFCSLRRIVGKRNPTLWKEMLDYEITKNEEGSHWLVKCRKANALGVISHEVGDIAFKVPVSIDTKRDVDTCVSLLASNFTFHEDMTEDSRDKCIAYLYSPKYTPITVFTNARLKPMKVEDVFIDGDPCPTINALVLEACKSKCPKYERYVTGAYISTNSGESNLLALRDKMCKTGTVYDANPKVFKATGTALLVLFDAKHNRMECSTHPDSADYLNFNPNAGNGFKHIELRFAKTKRQMAPFARRIVKRYLSLVREYIGESESLIPPAITTHSSKPEVRSVDDPPGKIRMISMLGLIHDFISKLCTLPFMKALERWIGCLIGTSIWSTLGFSMMRAMCIPEWMNLPNDIRGEDITPDNEEDWFYVTCDISGHDMSYSPVGLFMYLLMRIFFVDFPSEGDEEAFKEMFAVEFAQTNAKTVRWFSGYYYMVLGIMASGWLGTSHIATLMTVYSMYMAVMQLYINNKIHPKLAFEEVRMVAYGDDVVLKLRKTRVNVFGTDAYPQHLANELLKLGLTVKGSETQQFMPTRNHKNRFFTHIRGDEILSSGIHILQRYWVKYNARYQALHPDSSDYVFILPWRKTESYATKAGTDAFGFKGKEGRLNKKSFDVHVMAYLKTFGLLCDAGPNRTAHNFCKEILRRLCAAVPGVNALASQADRGPLKEVFAKLGPQAESICSPMITQIVYMPDNKSYSWIVSHIETDLHVRHLKKPEFVYQSAVSVHGLQVEGTPVLRADGSIYYI